MPQQPFLAKLPLFQEQSQKQPSSLLEGYFREHSPLLSVVPPWSTVKLKRKFLLIFTSWQILLFTDIHCLHKEIEGLSKLELEGQRHANHIRLVAQELEESLETLLATLDADWSLMLYFCSIFWTSESKMLRRLSQPLHLFISLLLLLKRKVFTSSFFWYVPSLGDGV